MSQEAVDVLTQLDRKLFAFACAGRMVVAWHYGVPIMTALKPTQSGATVHDFGFVARLVIPHSTASFTKAVLGWAGPLCAELYCCSFEEWRENLDKHLRTLETDALYERECDRVSIMTDEDRSFIMGHRQRHHALTRAVQIVSASNSELEATAREVCEKNYADCFMGGFRHHPRKQESRARLQRLINLPSSSLN